MNTQSIVFRSCSLFPSGPTFLFLSLTYPADSQSSSIPHARLSRSPAILNCAFPDLVLLPGAPAAAPLFYCAVEHPALHHLQLLVYRQNHLCHQHFLCGAFPSSSFHHADTAGDIAEHRYGQLGIVASRLPNINNYIYLIFDKKEKAIIQL